MSLEHGTVPLLAPRSTNWAKGPFDTNAEEIKIFKHWIYGNYLKSESNPNKKQNLVRMDLEHMALPLLAPRSTDWANGLFDTYVLQINNFYAMNIRKLLRKRK